MVNWSGSNQTKTNQRWIWLNQWTQEVVRDLMEVLWLRQFSANHLRVNKTLNLRAKARINLDKESLKVIQVDLMASQVRLLLRWPHQCTAQRCLTIYLVMKIKKSITFRSNLQKKRRSVKKTNRINNKEDLLHLLLFLREIVKQVQIKTIVVLDKVEDLENRCKEVSHNTLRAQPGQMIKICFRQIISMKTMIEIVTLQFH